MKVRLALYGMEVRDRREKAELTPTLVERSATKWTTLPQLNAN